MHSPRLWVAISMGRSMHSPSMAMRIVRSAYARCRKMRSSDSPARKKPHCWSPCNIRWGRELQTLVDNTDQPSNSNHLVFKPRLDWISHQALTQKPINIVFCLHNFWNSPDSSRICCADEFTSVWWYIHSKNFSKVLLSYVKSRFNTLISVEVAKAA